MSIFYSFPFSVSGESLFALRHASPRVAAFKVKSFSLSLSVGCVGMSGGYCPILVQSSRLYVLLRRHCLVLLQWYAFRLMYPCPSFSYCVIFVSLFVMEIDGKN